MPLTVHAVCFLRGVARFARLVVQDVPFVGFGVVVHAVQTRSQVHWLSVNFNIGRLLEFVRLCELDPPALSSPLCLPLSKTLKAIANLFDLYAHRRHGMRA